ADEDGDDHADEDGDDHADEETLSYDAHSWLNPLAFRAQVNVVLEGLTATFPAGEEVFKANADGYALQLLALHAAFDAAFGEGGVCMTGDQMKTVAANHNAYSYIAVQYGIQFVTVHGLDPEGEPSPEDLVKVVNFITEEGITVLFVEEYTDQSSVQSIVDETGVSIQILYTMEMAPSDSADDYMTMMAKNLENLVAGIGC
ncbi:MAG: zinc ABC transporter substrate-binding protein, partial [Candidatus Poseidoniaceae archaeon]